MTTREQLNSIAEKRILILDGAMGSLIQKLNLDEKNFRGEIFADHPNPLKGCNDLLCLTKPEVIETIHDSYLEAGADIIETCSFNSTSVSLSDYGLGEKAYEISAAAAKIARKSVDKFASNGRPRFVAGSIGPTAKGASLYPDINDPGKRSICWDELESAYYDNARGLLDGGADILLVETVFDTLNAKAALFAISRLLEDRRIDTPIMISAALSSDGGRLLSGQNLRAFCASVLHVKPWSIGLNCSCNAQKLLPHVRLLSEIAPCFVSAYPNAGLPDSAGHYDETPETMTANIKPYLEDGLVNIIGGCCGSTPAHISALAAAFSSAFAEKTDRYAPRKILPSSPRNFFSGLEPVYPENNIVYIKNTGDEKKEFLQSLADGEYEDAADTARDIIDNGAVILDIETDDKNAIAKFLDFALMNPYVAKAPFMINSSRMDVLETGLKRLQGRGFAGVVSLKDGEGQFIRDAQTIRRYGAVAVVALIDEKGQAETREQKIEIAKRVYRLLKENNYPIENIVFETGEDTSFCSLLQDNCPGVLFAL